MSNNNNSRLIEGYRNRMLLQTKNINEYKDNIETLSKDKTTLINRIKNSDDKLVHVITSLNDANTIITNNKLALEIAEETIDKLTRERDMLKSQIIKNNRINLSNNDFKFDISKAKFTKRNSERDVAMKKTQLLKAIDGNLKIL